MGLIGSVFRSGEVFTEPLRARILQDAPGARIARTLAPPVAGSLLLAARLAGRSEEVELELLERLLTDASHARQPPLTARRPPAWAGLR